VAGAAASALSQALLGKDQATDAELAKAVKHATPEQLVKLKQVENDFVLQMEELGFRREELVYKDVAGARRLFEINIWPQIVLSAFYTLGYFSVLIILLTKTVDIDADMKTTFNLIIGVLTAAVPMILQFWFGSSTGSKEKTARLTNGR
jgi:hypothetical protein